MEHKKLSIRRRRISGHIQVLLKTPNLSFPSATSFCFVPTNVCITGTLDICATMLLGRDMSSHLLLRFAMHKINQQIKRKYVG